MAKKRRSLGRVELSVLQFVSEKQPVRVKDVADYMAKVSGQARTTILTVLERLREKRYLSRKKLEGVNHYSTTVPKSVYLQDVVGDFVDGVLQGSVSPFVAYLNDGAKLTEKEREELKTLISKLESEK